MTIECPECGFEAQSNAGIGRHWSIQHEGECPVTKIQKECPTCGDVFIVKKSFKDRIYCSTECWADSECDGKIEKECVNCGNGFEVYPYREDTAKFCSHQCRHDWLADGNMPTGEDHPSHEGGKTKFECEWCSTTYYDYNRSNDPQRFCSQDCHHEWRSEIHVGPKHPLWKGGRQPYGDTWPRQKRRARQRDDYTCQDCGVHEDDYYRQLDVHHIQPIRKFDGPGGANDLSNLVTLCQTCHAKWEGIPLKPR